MSYKLISFDFKSYNVAVTKDSTVYVSKPPYSSFQRSNVSIDINDAIFTVKTNKAFKERLINLAIYHLLSQLYDLALKSNEGSPVFQDVNELSQKIFHKIKTMSFLFYENKEAILGWVRIASLSGLFDEDQSNKILEIFESDVGIANALNNRSFKVTPKLIEYIKSNVSPYINREGKWMEAKNAYFMMHLFSKSKVHEYSEFFNKEYKHAVKKYEDLTGHDISHNSLKRQANGFSRNAGYRDWHRKKKNKRTT